MWADHPRWKKLFTLAIYFIATIQVAWCYMRHVNPYMDTDRYEIGTDRMPFQGRVFMMLPLRWADHNSLLHWLIAHSWRSIYWFPAAMKPQTLMEALVYVLSLLITGWVTVKLYQASSSRRWLTPVVYPLVLAAFAATYILHTVQNYRFFYDPPSLAFFAVAMYLIYMRRHWAWFMALFLVATTNRETTLLLLPLYALDRAFVGGRNGKHGGRVEWRRLFAPQTLAVVVPLGLFWCAWTAGVHHIFAANKSEFYPRFDWNFKSLAYPPAWPQMLSAGGYLLLFVVVMRRRISDARLRAWMWTLPVWLAFLFTYGILIEVRIWGELIPWIVCSTALICEELLAARIRADSPITTIAIAEPLVLVAKEEHDVAQAA